MQQIVLKSADADAIARSWGMVGRVARLGTGEEAVLDVSALTGTSAALEAFVLALNRRAAARGVTDADEDDRHSGNTVLTVVIHPGQHHRVVTEPLDHYALYGLYLDVLGLSEGSRAGTMATAFGLPL